LPCSRLKMCHTSLQYYASCSHLHTQFVSCFVRDKALERARQRQRQLASLDVPLPAFANGGRWLDIEWRYHRYPAGVAHSYQGRCPGCTKAEIKERSLDAWQLYAARNIDLPVGDDRPSHAVERHSGTGLGEREQGWTRARLRGYGRRHQWYGERPDYIILERLLQTGAVNRYRIGGNGELRPTGNSDIARGAHGGLTSTLSGRLATDRHQQGPVVSGRDVDNTVDGGNDDEVTRLLTSLSRDEIRTLYVQFDQRLRLDSAQDQSLVRQAEGTLQEGPLQQMEPNPQVNSGAEASRNLTWSIEEQVRFEVLSEISGAYYVSHHGSTSPVYPTMISGLSTGLDNATTGVNSTTVVDNDDVQDGAPRDVERTGTISVGAPTGTSTDAVTRNGRESMNPSTAEAGHLRLARNLQSVKNCSDCGHRHSNFSNHNTTTNAYEVLVKYEGCGHHNAIFAEQLPNANEDGKILARCGCNRFPRALVAQRTATSRWLCLICTAQAASQRQGERSQDETLLASR